MSIDEIMALAERYATAAVSFYRGDIPSFVDESRTALESAIQELAKNAERYAWLREATLPVSQGLIDVVLWANDCGEPLRGEALDAAIDAEFTKEQK